MILLFLPLIEFLCLLLINILIEVTGRCCHEVFSVIFVNPLGSHCRIKDHREELLTESLYRLTRSQRQVINRYLTDDILEIVF